jgi:hypothetical protein
MKKQTVPLFIPKLLPAGASPKYARALSQKQGSLPAVAWHALTVVLSAYFRHAVQAANQYATAGTILLVVLCFGTSSMKWGSAALLASAVIGVVWRDAHMYKAKPPEGVPPLLHYAAVSGGDSATVAFLSLLSNAMLLGLSPSSALRLPELWRGGVICLPLLYTLRLYFNLKPDPEKPSAGSKSLTDLERLYRRVWWLGAMWMVSFMGVVACSVTDIPNYWPDRLKGLSVVIFGIWWAVQKDCLGRFDRIRTLFRDPAKLELRRKYAMLAKGLQRGEALYPGYIATEIVIYGVIALSLIDSVLPWLTGHPGASFMKAAAAVVSASTSILTWRAVKESNRLAAQAIQHEMHRTHPVISQPVGQSYQ